jgi:hypothetical protein
LDTMLAGQALGVNVVNGYSGLRPKGYPVGMALLQEDCCDELRAWAGLYPGKITSNTCPSPLTRLKGNREDPAS